MHQENNLKRKAESEPLYTRPAKAVKYHESVATKAITSEQNTTSKFNAANLPGELLGVIFTHLTPCCRIPYLGAPVSNYSDAHELPSGSILRVNKHWNAFAKHYFAEKKQDVLSAFYCRSGMWRNKLLDARHSYHDFDVRPVAGDSILSTHYQLIRFRAIFTKHDREKKILRIKVYGTVVPSMLHLMPKNKHSVLLVEAEDVDDPANDDSSTHLKYNELYTPQQIKHMVAAIKKMYFETPADATWLSEEARQGLQRKITALDTIEGMIKEGLEDQAELGDEAVGMDAMDAEDCYTSSCQY